MKKSQTIQALILLVTLALVIVAIVFLLGGPDLGKGYQDGWNSLPNKW